MNHEELLQQARDNLSDEYMEAVKAINLPERINNIGKQCDLSQEDTDILDQEVVYLVLHVTDSPEFTERLGEALSVDDEDLLEILNKVTASIIKPLQNTLGNKKGGGEDVPVPPPPGSNNDGPPTPSYGGTSDPYREPTDK